MEFQPYLVIILPFTVMKLLDHVLPDSYLSSEEHLQLIDEVRELLCTRYAETHDTDEFYSKVCVDKPVLTKVLPFLLCTPNSNAATERVFSILRYVHSDQRNRLSLETINSILTIKINKKTESYTLDIPREVVKSCKQATHLYNQSLNSVM